MPASCIGARSLRRFAINRLILKFLTSSLQESGYQVFVQHFYNRIYFTMKPKEKVHNRYVQNVHRTV